VRRLVLAALLLAASVVPALADYNVSGRFLYVDREFDANGFTGVEPQLPIRFADVQVMDGTKIVGAGVTDAAGNFVFHVVDSRTRDIYIRCLARRQTSTSVPIDVRSGNQSGDIWSIRSQTFSSHSPTQDVFIGTLLAVPGSGGEAFNLLDTAINGGDYLQFLRGGGVAPLLVIVYNAANPNLSSTSGSTITMANNAGYDDTVVLHEMGHYVVNNFSRTDSPGGVHHLSDCNQNIMLAFEEGHATAWGLSVRRYFGMPHASMYVRTTGQAGPGNLQFSFDAETQQPFVCYGATSETTVFAALWDLLDGPVTTDETPGVDEPWDMLQGQDAGYWKVMTQYIPSAVNISLEDFWDGWYQPTIANDHITEMISIFRDVGVEYFPDSHEPDDSPAAARVVVPGPTLYHETYFADRNGDLLGEPDTDVFAFDATAGKTYVIETMNLLSDANTDLELRAPDGVTVLASNNDRSATDPSSLIEYTTPTTGRLFVVSYHAPDYGIYGSYDLRIAVVGNGVDADGDGYTSDVDCNDNNASIHPGATEVCNGVDDNCNGSVDEGFDKDGDGFTTCGGDCNDANPAIRPGATEVCNSIDDDCDGLIDEGFDQDGDGYTTCGGDCNDANPQIHPNQPELCNGIDDNCNGQVDEAFDADGDGYTACAGDCNDGNAAIHPGAVEVCDGLDDDCDGLVDEGFPDTDGDGLADCVDTDDDNDGVPDALDCAPLSYAVTHVPVEVAESVLLPLGTVMRINWGMLPETNVYNLYRGLVDITHGWTFQTVCLLSESTGTTLNDATVPPSGTLYYYLQAGENLCGEGTLGTGSDGQSRPVTQACQPQGRDSDQDLVPDLSDDCPLVANVSQADADRDGRGDACDNCPTKPNATQQDKDANGIGDACQDLDGDGSTADVDCRDDDPTIHPGAPEICDGKDNDCDGVADEGFATGGPCSVGVGGCQRTGTLVCTADGSGTQCSATAGAPQTEICNSVDDDCDGTVDEGFDQDGDGYTTCGGDCADTVASVHPGAVEVFNGVDDDCNGRIDDVIEVVTITTASYQVSNSRLTVEATTNYPLGSVTLSVVGYGPMTWVPSASVYRLVMQPTSNPGNVTVVSTGGGSATRSVTAI
jgi:hypothetical protein